MSVRGLSVSEGRALIFFKHTPASLKSQLASVILLPVAFPNNIGSSGGWNPNAGDTTTWLHYKKGFTMPGKTSAMVDDCFEGGVDPAHALAGCVFRAQTHPRSCKTSWKGWEWAFTNPFCCSEPEYFPQCSLPKASCNWDIIPGQCWLRLGQGVIFCLGQVLHLPWCVPWGMVILVINWWFEQCAEDLFIYFVIFIFCLSTA